MTVKTTHPISPMICFKTAAPQSKSTHCVWRIDAHEQDHKRHRGEHCNDQQSGLLVEVRTFS